MITRKWFRTRNLSARICVCSCRPCFRPRLLICHRQDANRTNSCPWPNFVLGFASPWPYLRGLVAVPTAHQPMVCFLFTWTNGSEAGACWQGEHSDLLCVLELCMLEGKRMRTYDYYALLHEEDEEIQHGQPLIRKNSNVRPPTA